MRVESADLGRLAADLKTAGEKKLLAELRKGLKAAAEPIADQTRRNASWSRRIPGAVYVRPTLSGKNPRVVVVVNRKKAPHARPIENDGKAGTFVHPVFGREGRTRLGRRGEVMARQQARPFFYRAPVQQTAAVDREMQQVMDRVARAAGFR